MIIPIELRFKADKDSKSAFRTDKTIKSHDVNSVEFHISIEGLELTDNHTAKILSIFHSSESQANVDCEIVEGEIIYKPDTKLISRHEHVTSYVYVYNGNQSLDVREFIYVVDLSKIDETSLEVKEVYDQSYADLLADFEQALEDYKLTLPQADSIRADIDEILNQFSEDSQAKLSQYDADAQQVITDNQTAFELSESARQESYDQTQSLINEAESLRVQAETQRESAESSRVSAEAERVLAESERENAEDSREQSEGERKANEEARELAEDERENAEAQRKTDHANRSAELDGKADKVVIENLVKNGDFSGGSLGWIPHQGGEIEVVDSRLKVNTSTTMYSGTSQTINAKYDSGDIIYANISVDNPNNHGITLNLQYMAASHLVQISPTFNGVVSTVQTATRSVTRFTYFITNSRSNDQYSFFIDNVILINLTQTFGAGNEPTQEEMDELIKVTGYIDGEYALNNKEMLGYLMRGKADKKQEDWITPTLLNGAENYGGIFQFRKTTYGTLQFRGTLRGLENAAFFMVLPTGYRVIPSATIGIPTNAHRALPVVIDGSGGNWGTAGGVAVNGTVELTERLYFDGVELPIL